MADDDSKKNRFKERRDRDDEDDRDELPRPRRRLDDEDDRRDRRAGPGDRPPVLFLVGLIVGALAVTTCCGLSGWWTYATVVRGGSIGGSMFGGNDLEIVSASRTPGFGFNASPQVSWMVVVQRNLGRDVEQFYMVMQCGGVTIVDPFTTPPGKGVEVSQTKTQFALRNATGPLVLWAEKRTDQNKSGTRVSNKFTVR